MKLHLLFFFPPLMVSAIWVLFKNSLLYTHLEVMKLLSYILSSRIMVVLFFIFRSMVNQKQIFVYDLSQGMNLYFLRKLYWYHLATRVSFFLLHSSGTFFYKSSHCIFISICVRILQAIPFVYSSIWNQYHSLLIPVAR